jgi:hypothetical protein
MDELLSLNKKQLSLTISKLPRCRKIQSKDARHIMAEATNWNP